MANKTNLKTWFVMAVILLWLWPAVSVGGIIYVDDDGPADFNNIQAAIDDSNDGDIIIVSPGTYVGDGNRDIDFKGKAITVRSTDPNDPCVVAATIIDCNGTEAEPHRGFYFHSGENTNSIIYGLTITRGYYGGNYGGGAILCEQSSPTIRSCKIVSNNAGAHGGGVSCIESSPAIFHCTISDNWSRNEGGGIFCWDEHSTLSFSPLIVNCIISGNGTGYDCIGGGGLWCSGTSNPIIVNCTITANSTQGDIGAGGISSGTGSNPIITNCILWQNTISGDGGNEQVSGSVQISYSCIQDWAGGGTSNIADDPCFVNPDSNDFHLLPDSPCIDAGDNNSVPEDANDLDGDGNTTEPIPWDLDGRDRFVDGDCNDTVIVDMGAYEFTYAYYGDFDGSCDIDFVDYSIQADYWLTDEFLVDIAPTPAGDGIVDERDLDVLCDNWLLGVSN